MILNRNLTGLRILKGQCMVLLLFGALTLQAVPQFISPKQPIDDYRRFSETDIECTLFERARVQSDEPNPVFLGEFLPKTFPNSLFNSLGRYGTKFGKSSIWGPLSPYGSSSSDLSVNNLQAEHPPFILLKNGQIFRLNKTSYLHKKSISPTYLKKCYQITFYDE